MQLKLLSQFPFVLCLKCSAQTRQQFKQNFQELSARDLEDIPPNADVYFCRYFDERTCLAIKVLKWMISV